MNRTTYVLGNWKQNLTGEPAAALASAIARGLADARSSSENVQVGVAPTYLCLHAVRPHCSTAGLRLLAQDVGAQESGAFTGEVGPQMLVDAGVNMSIVGHSERRALFGDVDAVVRAKLVAARSAGLGVVLCVGEALEARDAGTHEKVVLGQLEAALGGHEQGLDLGSDGIVVAYEPVWAIGTGRTATPPQVAQMHSAIRRWLGERLGATFADRSVLYGGSVKPANAAELIGVDDVDGFLVGGASLDPSSFLAIVTAASKA